MARYVTYACGSCEGKFRWLQHPSDAPPPDNCPLCGAPTDGEPVFSPAAPLIKGVKLKAAEQVYRALESSSAQRAEAMAELGGGTAADYAHTKITDLNDQQREGDLATRMPPASSNEVAKFMAKYPHAVAGVQPQAAAAAAHTGYMPHAGDRSRQTVANVHGAMTAKMRSLGQLNRN